MLFHSSLLKLKYPGFRIATSRLASGDIQIFLSLSSEQNNIF